MKYTQTQILAFVSALLISLPLTVGFNQYLENVHDSYVLSKTEKITVDGLCYVRNSESTLKLVYDKSYQDLRTVTIPSTVYYEKKSYSVYCIGARAFDNCRNLREVVIQSGVKKIEEYAFFKCRGLLEVSIPYYLETIGNYAFFECVRLTKISIPASVISIGEGAFMECSSLEKANVPQLSIINEYTFYGCNHLAMLFIPSSVNSIRTKAFGNCENLDLFIYNSEGKINVSQNAYDSCRAVIYLDDLQSDWPQ